MKIKRQKRYQKRLQLSSSPSQHFQERVEDIKKTLKRVLAFEKDNATSLVIPRRLWKDHEDQEGHQGETEGDPSLSAVKLTFQTRVC
jgi:hypothetical protein